MLLLLCLYCWRVMQLLDTSGFLNRKAVWQKHVHDEGMGAIIFIIDANDRYTGAQQRDSMKPF